MVILKQAGFIIRLQCRAPSLIEYPRVALPLILAFPPTQHRQSGDRDVSDIWAELLRLDECAEGSKRRSSTVVSLETSLGPFALWNLQNLVGVLLYS